MEATEVDTFWDDCPLIERVPGKVSGAPVLKGTRLPADALVGNVESFIELEGMTEDQAIEATLECFPGTPGGAETIRALLTYQHDHLPQLQP
jgi:uncharacterized protein (DUF433 family)